ncbi:MAG: glycosyltransferase [Thermodesulfobacteriota bacterium]
MKAGKYILLSTLKDTFLNDLGNGYIREFEKNGATFIDYEEAYLEYGNRGVEEHVLKTARDKGAQVLVYQSSPSDFHFSIEFFRELQKRLFTVMTLGDSDHYFDLRDVYYGQCMDLVVVYDCLSRYRFNQYGMDAISFYSSFDGQRYAKDEAAEKDIDVSFVGDVAHKLERMEYIDFAEGNGVPVDVFGTGSKGGQVSLERMVEIFNRTKVNLNFTRISLKNAIRKEPQINLRLRQIKGRIAEIALCGGFVLTEYVPGIEEVFEPGTEVVTFDSRKEFIERLKYYLAHDAQREEIARRGHERALRDYDVGRAIPGLVKRIDAARAAKVKRPAQEIYIDPHFVRNYATFRMVMISRLIRQGRWAHVPEELSTILRSRNISLKKASGIFLFNLFPFLKKMYVALGR